MGVVECLVMLAAPIVGVPSDLRDRTTLPEFSASFTMSMARLIAAPRYPPDGYPVLDLVVARWFSGYVEPAVAVGLGQHDLLKGLGEFPRFGLVHCGSGDGGRGVSSPCRIVTGRASR